MSLSVLVLTFNEVANVRRCLDSVAWCDDVVIVDSGSTDGTVAIAESLGARVLQRPFDNFANQRNWGLEKAGFKHDWVLHLDADEVVPPEMHDEILSVIRSGNHAAYRTALKLIFQERWIRRASMFPAYQVRLGRRDRLRFKMEGHGQRETLPPEEVGTLETSLLHYSFEKGMSDWFEKHNRYSSAEAVASLQRRTQGEASFRAIFSRDRGMRFRAIKNVSSRLAFRPLLRFLYMAVIRRGFLDGIPGLHYCMLAMIYEYMIVLKEKEILQREKRAAASPPAASLRADQPNPQPEPTLALSGERK